jgi:glycosyltransferase involved in cell wall biosynthesis
MKRGFTRLDSSVVLHPATVLRPKDLSTYYAVNAISCFALINRILERESIDVIVYSNILPGLIAAYLGRRHRVPVVCDYSDHFADSAAIYYDNAIIHAAVRISVQPIVKTALAYTDCIVTISSTFADLLGEPPYCVPAHKIAIIPNGVDTSTFIPNARNEALQELGLRRFDGFVCVCYAGSIEPWSDLNTVMNTVDRLNREGIRVALFVVGGSLGTNYYRDLRSRFSDRDYIVFTGFLSQKKVPLYIAASDFCILPSRVGRISAGLPLKLLEYLACKRPVICTPIPEVVEALGDIVTPYRNPQMLASILKEFSHERSCPSASVEKGYQFALSRSWDRISALYERLLLDLVSTHPRIKKDGHDSERASLFGVVRHGAT